MSHDHLEHFVAALVLARALVLVNIVVMAGQIYIMIFMLLRNQCRGAIARIETILHF